MHVLRLLALALALAGPLGAQDDAWPVTSGAAPGYVPDEACADCHSDLWESYQAVGMARSFRRMTPEVATADFGGATFVHELSGHHYRLLRRGDEFFQRRWKVDEDGRRYAEIEQRIDWVVGSGNKARTYLYQTPSGELFQLPLTWYPSPGRWRMSPGYDYAEHAGFTRAITRGCMACHNAYPDVAAGSDLYGEWPHFPEELPEGIGCQRCHGPGAEHVALAESSEASVEAVRAAVFGPARMTPERRDDVCYQCHLQPLSGIDNTIAVEGRGAYSYRVGEALDEHEVHFDVVEDRAVEERFEINHHPYRLRQSRCYTESGGALSCLTCHDPHAKLPAERRVEHYRERCLGCHDGASLPERHAPGVALDDCVTCHMQEHRPQDVIQATMTDHLIRREPAPDDWLAPLPEDPGMVLREIVPYFPEGTGRAPDEELLPLYTAQLAVRSRMADMREELALGLRALEPDFADPWLVLAEGHRQSGDLLAAAAAYETATQRFPRRAAAWRGLAETLVEIGRGSEAFPALERARALAGDDPTLELTAARALAATRPEQAEQVLRRGLARRPNDADGRHALGALLLLRGDADGAVRELRRAVALAPTRAETLRLLGDAERAAGSWGAALSAWRSAAAATPDVPDLEKRVAFAYLAAPDPSVRDAARGLVHAGRGAEAASRDPAALALHALALATARPAGDAELAVQVARRAASLGADPVVCEAVAATALKRLSRPREAAAARRRAEAALATPAGELRERALELLSALGGPRRPR